MKLSRKDFKSQNKKFHFEEFINDCLNFLKTKLKEFLKHLQLQSEKSF